MPILRKPWTEQPPPGTKIDWSSPITRNLVVLVLPSEGELVGGGKATFRGAGSVGPAPFGVAAKSIYTGAGAQDVEYSVDISATGDRTLAALASNLGNSIGALSITGLQDADSNDYLNLGPTSFFGSIDNNGTASITVTEQAKPYFLLSRRAGNQQTASVDKVFTAAATTGTRALNATKFRIGRSENAGTSSITATVYLALYWTRCLNTAEVVSLADNPWQLFEPRRIIVPVAAAGGATTGSLPIVGRGPGMALAGNGGGLAGNSGAAA